MTQIRQADTNTEHMHSQERETKLIDSLRLRGPIVRITGTRPEVSKDEH